MLYQKYRCLNWRGSSSAFIRHLINSARHLIFLKEKTITVNYTTHTLNTLHLTRSARLLYRRSAHHTPVSTLRPPLNKIIQPTPSIGRVAQLVARSLRKGEV